MSEIDPHLSPTQQSPAPGGPPPEASSPGHAGGGPASSAPYLLTWVGLLLLLGLTMAAYALELGFTLSLAIALLKAILIALVFMHLLWSHAVARLAMLTGALLLALFVGLTLADSLGRY